MKFRSLPVVIEANQFTKISELPIGVFSREDGSCYTITIHGQKTNVKLGDWIILEPGYPDGSRAYPCKPDIFQKKYEIVEATCATIDNKWVGKEVPSGFQSIKHIEDNDIKKE